MKLAALAIVATLLGGCTMMPGATPKPPEQTLQQACDLYSRTLTRLEEQERLGLLADDVGTRVDAAVNVIEPICTRQVDYAADPVTAIQTVEMWMLKMAEEDQK